MDSTIKDNINAAVDWINENEMEQAAFCVVLALVATLSRSHEIYGFDNPARRLHDFLSAVSAEIASGEG
tara:strand:- start:207 stop:413 length:207 start_codon:yes stop_codon:yes gene_type:complete